jgi:hypothetical protein
VPGVQVTITSNPPGAQVLLGAKVLGQTPLSGTLLSAGRSHLLSARLEGFASQDKLVDVPHTGTVDVSFDLAPGVTGEAGLVTVDSTPETTVYTDKGRLLGRTPLKRATLPPGSVGLKLVNAAKGVEHFARVRVESGKETKLDVVIPKGTLKLAVTPWAEVYVDGIRLGTTPMPARELYAGRHELRLVNPHLKKDERQTVFIRPNEATKVKRTW